MNGPIRIRVMVVACVAALMFSSGIARAGGPFSNFLYPFISKNVMDRPDLLNFDPFKRSGGNTNTYSFAFTSMGETYTTTFPSYSYYGPSYVERNCFNDPDDKKMLVYNELCVRAGARRVSFTDASYILYNNYDGTTGFGFPDFNTAAIYFEIDGAFGRKVYAQGYALAVTDDGSEVGIEYSAEIPDKIKVSRKKIKLNQSAWVDVGGWIYYDTGEFLDFLGGFNGWFQGCSVAVNAKGEAFEDGKSDVGMQPVNKPGTLSKGKGKLDCDKDAVDMINAKIEADAGEDASTALGIWEAVLDKLGSKSKLKIRVNKKGTENINEEPMVL